MNRFAHLAAILVASDTMAMTALAAAVPSCQSGVLPCQAGCYFFQHQKCLPSPMGYYSPVNDNNLYICPAGTFAQEGASRCSPCTPGTSSWADGFGSCLLCGPGTYAYEGATSCSRCNPSLFWGPGSPGIFKEGSKLFCLDPRSVPSPSPTISWKPSMAPTTFPTMSPAPSHVPSQAPSILPSIIPTVQPTYGPTISPTTLSPTLKPTRSPRTSAPTPIGYRFPWFRRNSNKEDTKPLLPPNMLQQKSFKETAFQYMPLMVAAAVIFLFGWVYRKIYPPKTRRPLRTVPAPPPRPGEENEADLEAASSQNTEMLVPQRANISMLSHTDDASDDATDDATGDATVDATVDATDDAT